MTTFGETGIGATRNSDGDDYVDVSKFTLSAGMDVMKLVVYLDGSTGGYTGLVKGVIYADSSGPTTLKGVTQEITISPGSAAAWRDLVFSAPVTLTAADYWLGIHIGSVLGSGEMCGHYYSVVTNNLAYLNYTYSIGPPDPYGAPGGYVNQQMSIYASDVGPVSYTVLNGSDEQLLNINAAGTDVDAASYKDAVVLSETELATLLDGTSFGKKNVAVLPNLTGVPDARQIKKTTFSAETESA